MIFDTLAWAFGRRSVFFDRTTITPGAVWPQTIRSAVEQCSVLVAVIGKSWLATDGAHLPRIHAEDDWVRHEIRTALTRNDSPLVIPIFVDGAVPPRARDLPSDLETLPLRQGSSVREIPDFDHDMVAVVEQIAGYLGVRPAPFSGTARQKMVSEHFATGAGDNRQTLIAKVRAAWIQGVLEKALGGKDGFTLGLESHPMAMAQPRATTVPAPLFDSRDIAEVFEESDSRLLILGSPGSGKTILLLQLARQLLARTDHEIDAPIPVVLNLSSWAALRGPLEDWLVVDLRKVYQVPPKMARDWVERQQLVLLLDGLDEVAIPHRPACVDAINAYIKDFPTAPIAVCSRLADYNEIGAELRLRTNVQIQPLNQSRVDELIDGPAYTGIRAIAEQDSEFSRMLTIPFLLNLIRFTYQGESAERLRLPPTENPGHARREDLFEKYIEKRLSEADANSAARKPPFYRRDMRRWLAWLAGTMQIRNESVFYVEGLQSAWLSSLARLTHSITSTVVFGGLAGMVAGFALALVIGQLATSAFIVPEALAFSSTTAIAGGMICLHDAIARMSVVPLRIKGRGWVRSILPYVVCAAVVAAIVSLFVLLFTLYFGCFAPQFAIDILPNPLITIVSLVIGGAVYAALLLAIVRAINRVFAKFRWWRPWIVRSALLVLAFVGYCAVAVMLGSTFPLVSEISSILPLPVIFAPMFLALRATSRPEIVTVEQLAWRWSWRATAVGGAIGMLLAWNDIFLALPYGKDSKISPGIYDWKTYAYATVVIVTAATVGSVWGGLRKSERIATRQRPGDGIRRTFRYCILICASFATIGGTMFALIWVVENRASSALINASESAMIGAAVGLAVGLLAGLFASGSDELFKHFVLRVQLAIAGSLPFRVVPFLNHAADCMLARRVGAGYIFLHRYLLEHFARRGAIGVDEQSNTEPTVG